MYSIEDKGNSLVAIIYINDDALVVDLKEAMYLDNGCVQLITQEETDFFYNKDRVLLVNSLDNAHEKALAIADKTIGELGDVVEFKKSSKTKKLRRG